MKSFCWMTPKPPAWRLLSRESMYWIPWPASDAGATELRSYRPIHRTDSSSWIMLEAVNRDRRSTPRRTPGRPSQRTNTAFRSSIRSANEDDACSDESPVLRLSNQMNRENEA